MLKKIYEHPKEFKKFFEEYDNLPDEDIEFHSLDKETKQIFLRLPDNFETDEEFWNWLEELTNEYREAFDNDCIQSAIVKTVDYKEYKHD